MAVRPRNAEATKELLLAAAADEFAEYGLSGARIDRIAERAGANKRLLYVYFGNKDAVFDAVIERHLRILEEAAPVRGDDLATYAGAVFDHLSEHPRTLRLVTWRDLERPEPGEADRAVVAGKLAEIERAQRAGAVTDAVPAADLLAMVMRLAMSWLAAPAALHAVAGAGDPAVHRAALVEAVRRLTAPGS
jgi:AcrR family transcriptional regulator